MVLIANMQMERRKVGDYYYNHQLDRGLLMESAPSSKCYSKSSSPLVLHPCSFSSGGGRSSVGGCKSGGGGLGYIEHTVSKFDTLVGVAIKYGVEVADIKRMNGLTTDLQMFALKSLQIPLPRRHPPSPIMSNRQTSSVATPVSDRHSDLFNSIQSLKLSSSSQQNVSLCMNTLGYYGFKPNDQNGIGESFEMAVYHEGSACYSEDGAKPSQTTDQSIGVHRKSKSLVNGLSEKGEVSVTNNKEAGSDNCFEELVRRRKSEVDLKNHSPEMLVKQDNSSNSGAAKKGLALRQKAGSRTSNDAEAGLQNLFPLGLKEALIAETLSGVRKSSSTPSFQDSGNNNNGISSSLIWPNSMLSLTADLQALSTAAITMPIFDGLPNPIIGRKNKAALD